MAVRPSRPEQSQHRVGATLAIGALLALGCVATIEQFVKPSSPGIASLGPELFGPGLGHESVLVVVGGAVLVGTVTSTLATKGTVSTNESVSTSGPADRYQWAEVDARRSGIATGPAWRPVWAAVVGWSLLVSALHFGGLAYDVYSQVWWWDLMTHTFSGVGVGAWLFLLQPTAFSSSRRLLVLLPSVVFLLGAGFEIYEFLFRDFYANWSVGFYLRDTVEDMLCNLGGAVLLGLSIHRTE